MPNKKPSRRKTLIDLILDFLIAMALFLVLSSMNDPLSALIRLFPLALFVLFMLFLKYGKDDKIEV